MKEFRSGGLHATNRIRTALELRGANNGPRCNSFGPGFRSEVPVSLVPPRRRRGKSLKSNTLAGVENCGAQIVGSGRLPDSRFSFLWILGVPRPGPGELALRHNTEFSRHQAKFNVLEERINRHAAIMHPGCAECDSKLDHGNDIHPRDTAAKMRTRDKSLRLRLVPHNCILTIRVEWPCLSPNR
jgi:hypothetical protein